MEFATFEHGGKTYRLRRTTFGVQKIIERQYATASDNLRALVTVQMSLEVETSPGTGLWRKVTEAEFDQLDDLAAEKIERASIELKRPEEQRQAYALKLLELLPEGTPSQHAEWLARLARKEHATQDGRLTDPT
ncbi:MAG TPA: hypothetical protein VNJ87_00160 [Candidatus Macondimonas sp.]|nr:hypothetical protein [Candidatus Macondimonas sp.]